MPQPSTLTKNPSNERTSSINSELVKVQTLINKNNLSVKLQNTNYMIISLRNRIEKTNISLDGQPIFQIVPGRWNNETYLTSDNNKRYIKFVL